MATAKNSAKADKTAAAAAAVEPTTEVVVDTNTAAENAVVVETQPVEPVVEPTGDAVEPTGTDMVVVEPPVDPFANLPVAKLEDGTEVVDLTEVPTSPARKYAKVHQEALDGRLPVLKGWKFIGAMFVLGTNRGPEGGLRPHTVRGDIVDIVAKAGAKGIAAEAVATELRKRQGGANNRSHFCEALPPVGWAEGWINTSVTKGFLKVSATKAPKEAEPEAKATKAKADKKAA